MRRAFGVSSEEWADLAHIVKNLELAVKKAFQLPFQLGLF
jgi:diadenosine tetraphosphate (Ap4A) HIT family hydrolase